MLIRIALIQRPKSTYHSRPARETARPNLAVQMDREDYRSLAPSSERE